MLEARASRSCYLVTTTGPGPDERSTRASTRCPWSPLASAARRRRCPCPGVRRVSSDVPWRAATASLLAGCRDTRARRRPWSTTTRRSSWTRAIEASVARRPSARWRGPISPSRSILSDGWVRASRRSSSSSCQRAIASAARNRSVSMRSINTNGATPTRSASAALRPTAMFCWVRLSMCLRLRPRSCSAATRRCIRGPWCSRRISGGRARTTRRVPTSRPTPRLSGSRQCSTSAT